MLGWLVGYVCTHLQLNGLLAVVELRNDALDTDGRADRDERLEIVDLLVDDHLHVLEARTVVDL